MTQKATQRATQPRETNTPTRVFRLRGVRVAVFENKTQEGDKEQVFFKLSIQKVYRENGDGSWKTSTSLGRDDVPVAVALMQDAWRWILDTEAERYRKANGAE